MLYPGIKDFPSLILSYYEEDLLIVLRGKHVLRHKQVIAEGHKFTGRGGGGGVHDYRSFLKVFQISLLGRISHNFGIKLTILTRKVLKSI